MGLDMYAYTTRRKLRSGVDFPCGKSDLQIYYWRKHPNLHGWMQRLYGAKGGDHEFNCVNVALSIDDLDRLEVVITDGKLPETIGFFFGQSTGHEKDDDLEFIAKARAAIAQGLTVYYRAWW